MGLTPEQRTLRARLAAHSLHAQHDSRELTAEARAAAMRRFEDEVDPNGELELAERSRRATQARKAHFARLALKSSQARAKRARSQR